MVESGLDYGDGGTGLSPLQRDILAGKSPESLVNRLLGKGTPAVKKTRKRSKSTKTKSRSKSSGKAKYKNIKVKKKGGGTRMQRVQVLKSGKYKFVKNK